MIDISYTITIGNMLEAASVFGGGVLMLMRMRSDIGSLKRADDSQGEQIAGIQDEIKKIGEVLIKQATQDQRILHLEKDLYDMKRGRGFIQGLRGIDHEYDNGETE